MIVCYTFLFSDFECSLLIFPTEGSAYLLSFPFQPASVASRPEVDPPSIEIEYNDSEYDPVSAEPVTTTMDLDLFSLDSPHVNAIKHTFAKSGPKAKPVRVDVNGRKGRRAVCVLYGDGLRYEVLDIDAEMEDEEEEEDEGEEGDENE